MVRDRAAVKISCSLLVLALVASAAAGTRTQGRAPRAVDDRTLEWPDGRRFVTTLFGVVVIGQLPAAKKSPFLILAGRGCRDCDANVSIYIHSPSDGPMKPESSQHRYSYPGKVSYYLDGSPLSEARAFWGRCLPGRGPGVIWYHRVREEGGQWKPSVYFVEVIGDRLDGRFLNPQPAIQITLERVRTGECWEIPGQDMTSEP